MIILLQTTNVNKSNDNTTNDNNKQEYKTQKKYLKNLCICKLDILLK